MKKSVFITGAATGIGRATALLFARHGYFVGGYDIDDEGLKLLAADIGAVAVPGPSGISTSPMPRRCPSGCRSSSPPPAANSTC